MDASATAAWGSLFSAELGAAATLLGLVFVGISINLTRIMASGVLIDRSLEAVLLLVAMLVVATAGLVPIQPITWLGWEAFATGLLALVALLLLQTKSARRVTSGRLPYLMMRVVLGLIATLSMMLGGATLIAGNPAGLGALTLGMLFATISAVLDSWVLLVEILR